MRRPLHPAYLLPLVLAGAMGATACVRWNNNQPAIAQQLQTQTPPPAPPTLPQEPTPGPVEGTDTSWFHPRSSWAAARIDTSNIEPMQPIYRITVHHSGDAEDAIGNPEKHLREFERVHQNKGWACIGYHFVIARDGQVYEARPLKYQGAHSTGDNNIGNIGICLLGNFDNRPIPATQRQALESVIARLRKQYAIKRTNVFGHRDFKTTDCPGRYAMDWVEAYKGG